MRVVLDANVYVSALLTQQGNARKIMDLVEEEKLNLLISEPVLVEVERVLKYPRVVRIHRKSSAEIMAFIEHLRDVTELVIPDVRLSVSSDDADNRYLECAVVGKAGYLITGDKKHLLPIGEYAGVQILSPAGFLAMLRLEQG